MVAFLNVCKFNATAGTTADFSAATAVTGYLMPSAAGGVNGTTVRYRAESADLTQWEVGTATLTIGAGSSGISRNPTINSVGGTSVINFTAPPQIGLVALAADMFSNADVNPLTNSISSDMILSSSYVTGPTVAQGSSGTWWASGTVSLISTNIAAIDAKLWDGTTVVDSARTTIASNGFSQTISLSGYFVSPAGNIRISCFDVTVTGATMRANATGNSKDTTLSVFRIK